MNSEEHVIFPTKGRPISFKGTELGVTADLHAPVYLTLYRTEGGNIVLSTLREQMLHSEGAEALNKQTKTIEIYSSFAEFVSANCEKGRFSHELIYAVLENFPEYKSDWMFELY